MKKFAKLLIPVLAILLVAAFCAIPMNAADAVIFIADGGTGDGSSADSPLGSAPEHEIWSLEAYKSNAINLAIAKLAENGVGGTIVVSGPVSIKWGRQNESDAKNVSDFFVSSTALDPTINIKFTSVYNGVDYRSTNNAAVVLERTSAQALCLQMQVDSEWENLTFRINNSADRTLTVTNTIFACFNRKTVFGEGITTESFVDGKAIEAIPENSKNFFLLCGGSRYNNLTGDTNLTVKSGIWANVSGGPASFTSTTHGKLTGNTYLEFGGTAVTLTGINGGTFNTGGSITGNCETIISGGTIYGSVNAGGNGGFENFPEATVKVTVTGGDFTNCDSINDYGVGLSFDPPKYSLLDLSSLTVEAAQPIHSLVSYFDETVTPAGFAPATTAAPETTTAAPETTAAAPETTTAAPETTAAPADEPETTVADAEPKPADSAPIGLIIGIVAAVIVVAVVVIVVIKKKK